MTRETLLKEVMINLDERSDSINLTNSLSFHVSRCIDYTILSRNKQGISLTTINIFSAYKHKDCYVLRAACVFSCERITGMRRMQCRIPSLF